MGNSIVKLLKYILWAILGIIFAILLVGLAKSDRNLSTYISLLNQQNLSDFGRGNSIFHNLRGDSKKIKSNNPERNTTGSKQIDENTTGLDVYDPQFEKDMQDSSLDSILSGEDTSYGFKNDSTGSTIGTATINKTGSTIGSTPSSGTPQKDLLELIRQREMKK